MEPRVLSLIKGGARWPVRWKDFSEVLVVFVLVILSIRLVNATPGSKVG